MLLMGVNTAIGNQADQVQGTALLSGVLEGRNNRGIAFERIVGNHHINAGNVHLHDAARANIHVPHFAVAHLPDGQTDKAFRGLDQRVGVLAQQLVVSWFLRQSNGVIGSFRTIAPSVEDGQYEGTLGIRHFGYTSKSI
jgi:hypothetical protein